MIDKAEEAADVLNDFEQRRASELESYMVEAKRRMGEILGNRDLAMT
jgi:hypothetical protein